MDSDDDLSVVEDSEPERVATSQRPHQADSPEPPSPPGSPALAPVSNPAPADASPVASTSRYFAKPPAAPVASTSALAPRRREAPWANLRAPSPPPLSRKVSLPSTGAAPDEQPSPPKKPRKSLSDDEPPVKERKKKKKGRASQFQPASALLKANPALAVDGFDLAEDEKKPRKGKRPSKGRSSGESVEILDASLELDEPAPRKIDPNVFQRAALGLPPLVTRPDTSGDDSGDEGDASDDGSAASKLRTGLNQFKYKISGYSGGPVALPSIPIASVSRPVPPPPPPPLETPPLDHIKLLEACPVCEAAWTTTKTPKAKETHLRNCATEAEYTAETLLIRAENAILARARLSELERRERDVGRSLFERTIGTGEGKGAREVTVVGVERAGDGPIDQYDPARIEAAQAEIDAAKKRTPVDALTKVATKIKDRRRLRDEDKARRAMAGVKAEHDDADNDMHLPTPRPTGVLRVDSAEARADVAAKAQAVLDGLAGTGLTQALDAALLPSLMDVDDDGPPSTQPFEPSRLATKLAAAGAIDVVSLPMKERQAVAVPSGGTKSLWRAADGSDDATIRRVVSISSLSSTSPSPARRSSAPFESPTQRSPSTSSTLDPSLTARMSGMDMEHGAEAWEDEWAGQDDGLLVCDGERMYEDDYEQPPTTITTPAVPPPPASTTKPKLPPLSTTKPKPKPRPRAKGKAKARVDDSDSPGFDFPDSDGALDSDASASPPPVPSTSRPPGMPDYNSYTLAKLQTEVARYGFRVSKERSVLVDQLTQVWIAMHPAPPPPATPAKKPRAKARSKKLVPNSSDDNQDAEETVGERLRKLIAANDELYLKVLRYEPIFFDEIVSLATANGVKNSKPLLMRCLDEQCITFYTQDPTNGSRKRYK